MSGPAAQDVKDPRARERRCDALPDECQVLVAGGGPAGSTAAALLAAGGAGVVLLEREEFPRFHIGESLMTETWWTLDRLGLIPRLEASDFPRKYSVQFVAENGKASRPFYFFETNPHPSAVTWQVDRAEFDALLLENAREKGARVFPGVAVKEVLFAEGRARGVRTLDTAGRSQEIRASVVVDATGLGALLGRQLRILRRDPGLRKAAVFAHFHGAPRAAGIDEGATVILHTRGNRGWFWFIPLSRDRVSIGVVGEPGEILKGRGPPEEVLAREIETCPAVAARLEGAKRCTEVRVVSDYSYRAAAAAGPGWVLAGDAFGFIDPIYSSGVFLALKSGEWAAEAVLDALARGDASGATLGRFAGRFTGGMEALRKLVYAFYTPGFSFARFVAEHPEHRTRLVDLLTGNVFKEGVQAIFDDLKAFCRLPEPMSFPRDFTARGGHSGSTGSS